MTQSARWSERLAVALCAIALIAVAAPAAGADGSADAAYPERVLAEDLEVLVRVLEEVHPGIDRYQSPADFESIVAAARSRIRDGMTERELLRVLSPVVASVRCAHTVLLGSSGLNAHERSDARLFPLRVRSLEGRLWVRDACGTPGVEPGSEIRKINGVPAQELVARLAPHGPADGSNDSRRIRYLERRFASQLWRFGGPEVSGSRSFRLETDAGKVVVSARPGAEVWDCVTARERDPGRPFSLDFLAEGRVALLTLPTFVPGRHDVGRFLASSFAEIEQRAPGTLIIDLRGNPGGFDELGIALMQYIAVEPFVYYEALTTTVSSTWFARHLDAGAGERLMARMMRPSVLRAMDERHPGLEEKPAARAAFRGPVLVLADGTSASTAAEFCALAQHLGRARLVGEECGGGYTGNHSGLIRTFRLPGTHIRFTVPFTRYDLAVSDRTNRGGARPDHAVAETIESVLAGEDVVLERALSLSAGQ